MSGLDDIAGKLEELLSDEESMKQIRELAAMFSAEQSTENTAAEPSAGKVGDGGGIGIDPFTLIQLFGAASGEDKDRDLLLALRPHLSPVRQQRIDKAVKMLKLYRIFLTLRDSGMLNDLENML